MALTKLERIEREIEKTRGKITEYQNKLKELEAQRTEQENFEIVGIVRSMCMTRDELMDFLRSGGNDAPPAENVYHEQEDRYSARQRCCWKARRVHIPLPHLSYRYKE